MRISDTISHDIGAPDSIRNLPLAALIRRNDIFDVR